MLQGLLQRRLRSAEPANATAKASSKNARQLKEQLVNIFRAEAHNMRYNRVASALIPGRPMRDVKPDQAAEFGYLGLVQAFDDRGRRCTQDGADVAARNGNVEVVRYLRGRGIHCTVWGAHGAAPNGHLDVIHDL